MSEAPLITEGAKVSSLGERLYATMLATARGDRDFRVHGGRFHEQPPVVRALYERAAVTFVASLTYTESEGVREALLSSVLLEALKEARDLLLERTQGNPARSAGHNARLTIDAAIAQAEAS